MINFVAGNLIVYYYVYYYTYSLYRFMEVSRMDFKARSK